MLSDRVSNPGPLTYDSGALPIALRGPAPNFKNQSQMVLKRSFECFFMYFYGSNRGPSGVGPFRPRGHHLTKLGKSPLGHATTEFQASESSGSEEDSF